MISNFNFDKSEKTLENLFEDAKKAQYLYNCSKFQQAYKLIKRVEDAFDRLASINFHGDNFGKDKYMNIYFLSGRICAQLGKYDEAITCFQKFLFFNFQIYHDFRDCDSVTLFQFRNTKQYTLYNLANNEITLVDPRIQNDIVDTPIFAWAASLYGIKSKHKEHIKAFQKALSYLRSTSFCSDSENGRAIENTLMWAHYANCHKGICVQYELKENDFSSNTLSFAQLTRLMKIKYYNPNKEKDILDFTNPNTKLYLRTALAGKSIEWSYENEVRLVAYSSAATSKFLQYKFETPNPIKAIYFGVRCPTQRINKIKRIFENRPDVKFYRMHINIQNIHRLIAKEIK